MGIIRRQTLSGSFFSYAGVLLGFLNLAVLMPLFFTTEQIGLPALIIAVSIIASQLGSLGFNGVTIRLFPYFRDKDSSHKGFLGLSLLVQSIGMIVVIVGMIFFIPGLIERNSEDNALLGEFAYLIIPLLIFQLYFVLFDSVARVFFNAALGIFLKEFLVRILNLILILLFSIELISFSNFIYLYVLVYGIPTFGMIVYFISKREFSLKLNLHFVKGQLGKEIISVSVFGIIAGLSGIAVMNIDRYMINEILNLSSLGVYTIAFSFGTLILIPGRAMAKIAGPVIAELWKDRNKSEIQKIYTKSSINQFLGGIVLLLIIWISIDDVFALLSDEYSGGKYVILFIALANLFTSISGVSNQILLTSSAFRYHSFFMVVLIVLVIISNILFIPRWGITGAAIATMASTGIYVLIRMVFLLRKFGMQPFKWAHLLSTVFALIVYIILSLTNFGAHPLINILIRSSIGGILFILPVYIFKLSPDFNNVVREIAIRVFKRGPS